MTRYGIADLHIHTSFSDGMMTIPQLLDHVERNTRLDVIAITDHDEVSGSLEARDMVARGNYRFEVITGAEISTSEGHLLALFIERPVPSSRPLAETMDAVQKQGGLCIVPHPLSWLTRSIGETALDQYTLGDPTFDGIEISNGHIAARVTCQKARRLNAQRYHLSEVGGSDAHFLPMVGTSYTIFHGKSAADLKNSLLDGTTRSGVSDPVRLSRIGCYKIAGQLAKGLLVLPVRALRRSLSALGNKAAV